MQSSHLLGQTLLLGALAATVVSMVGAWRWWRGREASRSTAAWGAYAAAGLLVSAFSLLLFAFMTSDFGFAAVASYSSRDLVMLYKVSAVWAGQEGSLLLWSAFAALLAIPLLRLRLKPDPLALVAFQGAQIGLLLVLISQAPFELLANVPPDGSGLNPLLQDPWMATHPPVVFFGYAAAALPFALALSAIWRGERFGWPAPALRWTLVTVLTLGTGILLGAFWAYEVLGWGGYWGWDPVENSSLIPWIVAVAMIHGLLVQRHTGALGRLNLIMALGTYILVIYATFLTRSGVLAAVSVHSFPGGGVTAPLVTLLAVLTGVSVVSLARRWGTMAGEPLSWKLDLGTVLTLSLGLLLVSAAIILGGTSWPMLLLINPDLAVPKPSFYNQANLPVYVLISSLLVAAPLLAWKTIPVRRLARVSAVPVLTGLATAVWAVWGGIQQPFSLALMLFSGAAVGSCIVRAVRVVQISPLRIGAPVAHVGMALLLMGVLISSLGERREQIELPLGADRESIGQTLRFVGIEPGDPKGRKLRVIVDPNGQAVPAKLELVETFDGQIQRKPAIVRRLRGDIYLSPIGVDREARIGRQAVLQRGRPIRVDGQPLLFENFSMQEHSESMHVVAVIRLPDGTAIEPALIMTREGGMTAEPAMLPNGMQITVARISVEEQQIVVDIAPPGAPIILYVEASWKPGMNVLWGGSLLLCLGTLVAFFLRSSRQEVELPAAADEREAKPPKQTRGGHRAGKPAQAASSARQARS